MKPSLHAAATVSSQTEGEDENKLAQHLTEAFAELKKLDEQLIESRKPAKKIEAAIKGIYDTLEKRGHDRKMAKLIYKAQRGNTFSPEAAITYNAYNKALGTPLPLFDLSFTSKH